ncbi:MAG TPA: hypothetical protein DCF68_07025 [Cyanothece sp. UBA12306]|nr:hypothetical protein [Cyanothece sp. UBA12306]
MLKLIYTENGCELESLTQVLEEWVNNRVLLALRSGTDLSIKPSTAAFLLPSNLTYLEDLVNAAKMQVGEILAVNICDRHWVEVVLQGTWLTSEPDSEEGLFVCQLSDRAEYFLHELWQEADA